MDITNLLSSVGSRLQVLFDLNFGATFFLFTVPHTPRLVEPFF